MTQTINFASPAASACLKESLLFGLTLRPANSERVTFHNQTIAQELCPNPSAGTRNPGRNLNPVTDSPGEMLTPSRCPRSSSGKLPAHSTKFHREPPVISHFSRFSTPAFHVEFSRLPTPFRHPFGLNTASSEKRRAPLPICSFQPGISLLSTHYRFSLLPFIPLPPRPLPPFASPPRPQAPLRSPPCNFVCPFSFPQVHYAHGVCARDRSRLNPSGNAHETRVNTACLHQVRLSLVHYVMCAPCVSTYTA